MATLNPAKGNGYYSVYDNKFHTQKNDLYMNDLAIDNAIHYVTRTGKRYDRAGELVAWGASGCCYVLTPDDCILQFKQVQKLVRRKNDVGTQIVHEILTFTDEEEKFFLNNINLLIQLAQYCANIYYQKGFQCIYGIHNGVHFDECFDSTVTRKRLHIHFVINAVSFITGNKFATKLSSKVFTLNGETFFKIPYDTKERERLINELLYTNIICMDNPYRADGNKYLENAYIQYPKHCN